MSHQPLTAAPALDTTALLALCAGLLPVWQRHLAAARAQSQTAVGTMITAFSNISPHIDHTQLQPEDPATLAGHIDRLYIGFQYQDRTSQMMALLETDIARLHQTLTGQQPAGLDLDGWLSRLESEYAMAEQHDNHAATKSPTIDPLNDNETTFF